MYVSVRSREQKGGERRGSGSLGKELTIKDGLVGCLVVQRPSYLSSSESEWIN